MEDPVVARALANRREQLSAAAHDLIRRYDDGEAIEAETLEWAEHFVRCYPRPKTEGRRK